MTTQKTHIDPLRCRCNAGGASTPALPQRGRPLPARRALLPATCYQLHANAIDPVAVAFSFEKIVTEGEWSRLFTSALSHFDLMHLGFNAMTLYQLGPLEEEFGSARYAYLSFALVLLTGCICLAMSHYMIHRMGREDVRHQLSVGYSCVLFAWVTVAALNMNKFCPIIFAPNVCFNTLYIPVIGLPFNIGPVVLLVITKVIIPRSSFMGHLSGIVAGFPLAWHLLDWLHPLTVVSVLASAAVLHARDHLWVWSLPLGSSWRQDAAFVLSGIERLLRASTACVATACAASADGGCAACSGCVGAWWRRGSGGGGGGEHVYTTVSLSEEGAARAAPPAGVSPHRTTGESSSDPTTAAALTTVACITPDPTWVFVEDVMVGVGTGAGTDNRAVRLYEWYRWSAAFAALWGLGGACLVLAMLVPSCNVALWAVGTLFPTAVYVGLLWAAHQGFRICHLSDVTSAVRASVQLVALALVGSALLAANSAATVGAYWGSFAMIDINTSMTADGRYLPVGSGLTSSQAIFVYYFVALVLQAALAGLLLQLLPLTPNVERGDALRRMGMPWLERASE